MILPEVVPAVGAVAFSRNPRAANVAPGVTF
jgi:hypothetical protein